MDASQAKRTIVLATGGMVLITTLSTIGEHHELPSASVPLGAAVAGIMLAGLAEFAPAIAGGLAAIALTTSVFVYGGPAFDTIRNLTKQPGG